MAENSRFTEVLVRFFKMIFCPTSWFILKQLDNLPSLSMNDSASLTICSWTTRASCLIVKYIHKTIMTISTKEERQESNR